jgi:hypothetical protein
VPRFAPFRGGRETYTAIADAMARLLGSRGSRAERAQGCTLPTSAHMADQLLETLTAVTL